MNYQPELDFTHKLENNERSQTLLDSDRVRISKRVVQVLRILSHGGKLTVKSALVDHDISSLPRRILDIEQKFGIRAERRDTGYTTYWFNEFQQIQGKQILLKYNNKSI